MAFPTAWWSIENQQLTPTVFEIFDPETRAHTDTQTYAANDFTF